MFFFVLQLRSQVRHATVIRTPI